MNAWTNSTHNRINTIHVLPRRFFMVHLIYFSTVNHSSPLCSLLAAGLNQFPINALCQQGYIVKRGTLAEAPGRRKQVYKCVYVCVCMCVCQDHYGVRAYSVIFQTQNTLFKDSAGPA